MSSVAHERVVPSLRLAMVVHSSQSLLEATRRLDDWVSTLADAGQPDVPSCLWVTGHDVEKLPLDEETYCVHRLLVPREVDRYIRTWDPRARWSPWGLKSGPNFQFFRVLEETHAAHPEQWVFLLETDVVPLRPPTPDDLRLDMDSLWVVGAHQHPAVLRHLDANLWNHLNGAALYHVGDAQFRAFLESVWKPSLLYLLHENPTLAYDCLTSPELWSLLPELLQGAWEEHSSRFSSAPGMINASSLSGSRARGVARESRADTALWLLHARL